MGLLKMMIASARRLPATAGLAAAGWTAYSSFGISHDAPLPRPVPGEAGKLDTPDSGEVAVYQMGPDEGTPVLLVHGVHAAASAYDLGPLYTALASRGYRVTAFDLPGFGHSERTDRHYDQDTMIRATTTVLEKVVQQPAHVVALSLGSEFAAAAANARPDLARTISMISPTGLGRSPDGDRPDWLGSLIRTPVVGQAVFDAIASRPSIRYFLDKSFVGEVDNGYLAYAFATAHQPAARFAVAAFLSGTLFDPHVFDRTYARLGVPAMAIYDRDPYSGFDRLPELTERPLWTSERLVPSSGLPHFEMLDRTLEVLEAFWQQPPGAVHG